MMKTWRALLVGGVVMGLSVGCGDPDNPGGEPNQESNQTDPNQDPNQTDPNQTDPNQGPASVTYYQHAQPIIEARCGGCHGVDDIGGLELITYEGVYSNRLLSEATIREGTMPPWLAGDECTEYRHSFALKPEERELLLEFFEEGAAEGDPADPAPPLEASATSLSRVDVELEMPVDYEPRLQPDDYRCFPIDWTEEEPGYITGFNVSPGNPEIVHHVIAFYAPPELAAEVEAREAAEEGPGYTCFGTPGISDENFGRPGGVAWLGSWAPGGLGIDFPEGTGLPVEPGSKVIVQVHYNTYEGETHTDRSAVQFRFDETVERSAMYLPWANPNWLSNPNSMLIPAGDAEVRHSFGFDIASMLGANVRIYSANLHMHLLGTRGRQWIQRSTGQACLLDVPRWDFNWQYEFVLEEPEVLAPGDQLWIECEWDNSAANQPIIQGERIEPQDVRWGDGTTDEMCLGIFYVTFE